MKQLTRIETVVFLQKVDLFSACSAEQILRISAIVNQASFASGETIYQGNDPSECMYCIVDGSVELAATRSGDIAGLIVESGFAQTPPLLAGRHSPKLSLFK